MDCHHRSRLMASYRPPDLVIGAFGREEGWLQENPALKLRVETSPSRTRVWPPTERDAFCNTAGLAGRPSMALAVMLGWCFGQRPADLRTLPWSAYDGNAVNSSPGENRPAYLGASPSRAACTPRSNSAAIESSRRKAAAEFRALATPGRDTRP